MFASGIALYLEAHTWRHMSDDDELSRAEASEQANKKLDILRATLSAASEQKFLRSVWAIRAIQSNRLSKAEPYLIDVPDDAFTSSLASKAAIYPWELELFVNERLAIERDFYFQVVRTELWPQWAALVNLLRDIENLEYASFNKPEDVIDYVYKIGNRQFDWQQGFATKQEIFRNTYVYGSGICADYFLDEYGVSVNQFSVTCFAYLATFFNHPQAKRDIDLSIVGVEKATREKVLSMVSKPLRVMRWESSGARGGEGEIAFKPSVLRQYPMIGLGATQSIMSCPLPDLLASRMTSGLFYDVIGGGGPVRAEIGTRFERYCLLLLNRFLEKYSCSSEVEVQSRKGTRKSSDLMIADSSGAIVVIAECKATRLSARSRFADFDSGQRGYRDMLKGILQIWQTTCDIRTGRIDGRLSASAVGTLITMDSWFVAAPKRQEEIIELARIESEKSDSEVTEEDRIPVSFVFVPELERSLAFYQEDEVIENFRRLAKGEERGFSFDVAMKTYSEKADEPADFPFEMEMAEVLPWWGSVTRTFAERAAR
jgi:hypothetical protein